jgi:hypothetical protein
LEFGTRLHRPMVVRSNLAHRHLKNFPLTGSRSPIRLDQTRCVTLMERHRSPVAFF